MAVSNRAAAVKGTDQVQIMKKWKERETSPERNIVWTEPPNKHKTDRKVPVVYYLSRNGQLEHPHFMEVPLSSSDGLYLRDVINRLNLLRGKGMAALYSWSSKRSYKNGFVWHDLVENDFIYPAHGQEYVLKGSELVVDGASILKPAEAMISSSFRLTLPENQKSGEDSDSPVITRRRNQSWSAIDLHEYKVYKAESPSDAAAGRAAANASTQTDDKRRRRRVIREIEEEHDEEKINEISELNTDEISPPPSDSSPETLESLMKADGRLVISSGNAIIEPSAVNPPAGRLKASSVLMQLISCGSMSFRDCGPGYGKNHPGLSLISHYKGRLPRGRGLDQVQRDVEKDMVENPSFGGGRIKLEEKEYFSGSLIETKKEEFPALKRSSSYNADRSSHVEVRGKHREGLRTNCIPRKPKVQSTHKEGKNDTVLGSSSTSFSDQNGITS